MFAILESAEEQFEIHEISEQSEKNDKEQSSLVAYTDEFKSFRENRDTII